MSNIWIPSEVAAATFLTWPEKIALSQIYYFEQNGGKCTASNSYFAELLQVSKVQASNILSKLQKLKIIEIDNESEAGKRRFINTLLNYTLIPALKVDFNTPLNSTLIPPQSTLYDPLKVDFNTPYIGIKTEKKTEIKTSGGSPEAPASDFEKAEPEILKQAVEDLSAKNPIPEKEKKDSGQKKENAFRMEDVIWPYDSPAFRSAWELWAAYRKERRFGEYKPIGLQAAFKDLAKISGGNEETAINFIHNAIAKSWQGIYPNKDYQHGKPNRRNAEYSLSEWEQEGQRRRAESGAISH